MSKREGSHASDFLLTPSALRFNFSSFQFSAVNKFYLLGTARYPLLKVCVVLSIGRPVHTADASVLSWSQILWLGLNMVTDLLICCSLSLDLQRSVILWFCSSTLAGRIWLTLLFPHLSPVRAKVCCPLLSRLWAARHLVPGLTSLSSLSPCRRETRTQTRSSPSISLPSPSLRLTPRFPFQLPLDHDLQLAPKRLPHLHSSIPRSASLLLLLCLVCPSRPRSCVYTRRHLTLPRPPNPPSAGPTSAPFVFLASSPSPSSPPSPPHATPPARSPKPPPASPLPETAAPEEQDASNGSLPSAVTTPRRDHHSQYRRQRTCSTYSRRRQRRRVRNLLLSCKALRWSRLSRRRSRRVRRLTRQLEAAVPDRRSTAERHSSVWLRSPRAGATTSGGRGAAAAARVAVKCRWRRLVGSKFRRAWRWGSRGWGIISCVTSLNLSSVSLFLFGLGHR